MHRYPQSMKDCRGQLLIMKSKSYFNLKCKNYFLRLSKKDGVCVTLKNYNFSKVFVEGQTQSHVFFIQEIIVILFPIDYKIFEREIIGRESFLYLFSISVAVTNKLTKYALTPNLIDTYV